MRWKQRLEGFNFALGFLTRLGVPRMADDAVLAHSVRYYGLAGLIVGMVCTLPLFMAQALGFASAWVLAWCYLLLDIWVTRGLHYDGLADLGDAWGSGSQGERFWQILRDSRLGAFGALALALGISGQLIGVQARVLEGAWLPLLLAPAFGRAVGVVLAWLVPPHDPASLGGKACAGATISVAAVHALLALGMALMLPWKEALGILAAACALVYVLRRVCTAQGGCNGDILGASMVGAQVIFLLI